MSDLEDLDDLGYRRELADLVSCGVDLYLDADNGDEADIAGELAENSQLTIYTRHCFAVVRYSPNRNALFEFDPEALSHCSNAFAAIERMAYHALREDILQGMKASLQEAREEVSNQTGGHEVEW